MNRRQLWLVVAVLYLTACVSPELPAASPTATVTTLATPTIAPSPEPTATREPTPTPTQQATPTATLSTSPPSPAVTPATTRDAVTPAPTREVIIFTPEPLGPTLPCTSDWPTEMRTVLGKLPVDPGICLIRIPDLSNVYCLPLDDPTRFSCGRSCPVACISYGRYVKYYAPGVTSPQHGLHVLHHEVCHSHQYRITAPTGNPRRDAVASEAAWLGHAEGLAFAKAFDEFKSLYPGESASWGTAGYFEDFAEVCAAWYYPTFRVQKVTSFQPLREFAEKWLPK